MGDLVPFPRRAEDAGGVVTIDVPDLPPAQDRPMVGEGVCDGCGQTRVLFALPATAARQCTACGQEVPAVQTRVCVRCHDRLTT